MGVNSREGPSSKVRTTPSVPSFALLITDRKKLIPGKNGARKQRSRKSDKGRRAKFGVIKKQSTADTRATMPIFSALQSLAGMNISCYGRELLGDCLYLERRISRSTTPGKKKYQLSLVKYSTTGCNKTVPKVGGTAFPTTLYLPLIPPVGSIFVGKS